ncbi:MFS transporter prlG [Fulvia fulva]|uniref:MFS transporter prlG n=1 Tax=Passalora fulva TaxID=5499 RepID=A0A9Q8P9E5_PASFU|nr:MFS transporter prlG [Fulvia fulva]KAK4624492.1 MFS transporter prlG [Fulvia fulva]KAK4625473.1 MFS transporter prlG [Fulvia fulva]UJO18210.1 MFS transporter prlG [Fulvia fulva]WPV14656.1 MFS transporter prlG [Fulvia fulva]WPV29772.1 MFS transporter prlG [Fulvia fulva]
MSDLTDVEVDARAWPTWRKITTVIFVAGFAFLSTSASSIIAPGREQIEADFHTSRTVSVLPFSIFNLGLAWGSVIGSPISESHGRKIVYLFVMPASLVFVLGSGFSKSLASLLVCRFLGGLCGSPGLTLASATIADVYKPGRARGVALYGYYSMPWVGSVLGPLIGSVVVAYRPWQWTQWVFLFIAVPMVLPGLLMLKETKLSVLEAKVEKEGNPYSWRDTANPTHLKTRLTAATKAVPKYFRSSLLRPLEMLSTELIVALVCLYAGFNFGLIYALVIVFPDIFSHTYGFDTIDQGLSFLGLIVGCILGPTLLIVDGEIVERRRARMIDQEKLASEEKLPPEARLHGAMIGSVLLPVGLLWFAWTAQPSISFLSSIFASVLITLGALMIYVSTSAYVVDVYGPRYGASANAASSITRYTLAAAIPLFILQMYDGLGIGWATTLLAVCALVMMPIPFCLFKWGPALRRRCKFQVE